MIRERYINLLIGALLLIVPLVALQMDEPFIITLATKAAILALAGVGLNLALGQGGLVSFGHAAYFGMGGYAMGILASHAQDYVPLMEVPFLIRHQPDAGHLACSDFGKWAAGAGDRGAVFAYFRRLFHHGHTRLWADVLLLRNLMAGLWR